MPDADPTIEPPENYSEKLSMKERFAEALVGELPSCPECSKILKDRYIRKCDYCGFSFSYLEQSFPTEGLPPLTQINDLTKTLSGGDTKEISRAQDLVTGHYPQFSVKICLLPLQKNIKLNQMALWMLNQCPAPSEQSDDDKKWTILILTDSVSRKSCIAAGYNAEIFLSMDNVYKIVANLNSTLRKGIHAKGYLDAIHSILQILDGSKNGIKSRFKAFKKKYRK